MKSSDSQLPTQSLEQNMGANKSILPPPLPYQYLMVYGKSLYLINVYKTWFILE